MEKGFGNVYIQSVFLNTAPYVLIIKWLECYCDSIRMVVRHGIDSKWLMIYMMRFLVVDVNHFGAYFTSPDIPSTVGFMKIDFEAWKFLLTILAHFLIVLLFHIWIYY